VAQSATKALGKAIRVTRTEKGLTQEGFALANRINRSYYGAIERGEANLTIETIVTIAKALGVPAWELWRRASL
jgi:transcriptional regulator with XRE-family HTH domain